MTNDQEPTSWNRVRLDVNAERIDEAAALLWTAGASGVEIRDGETFKDQEEPIASGHARAVAFFGGEDPETIQARLEAMVHSWSLGSDALVRAAIFTDETWKERWKQFFKPAQVSQRLAVGPPWEPPTTPEGGFQIIIEPGMAFGTGTHATTRLCLEWIDRLCQGPQAPKSILDVGCGSGILSIAAALLSDTETRIDALDVDPEAIRVSRENLVFNGIAEGRVQVMTEPLTQVSESYSLVVANILAHILMLLSDELVRCTASDGQLLLCGVGLDSVSEVIASFSASGMTLVEKREMEGWAALLMEHTKGG